MSEQVVGIDLGMGWLPDYPDLNDFTIDYDEINPRLKGLGQTTSVKGMLSKAGVSDTAKASLSTSISLKSWFSPIENQGALGSCTAQAGVALVEYFERRAFGKHIDASRLFLYKVTRNLLNWQGDTGAFMRTTMGGMVLFGVPPEKYWPYHIPDFDEEPSCFCYSFAQNYQALQYYRFDPVGIPRDVLLNRLKLAIAAGFPVMLGFTVFSSISQAHGDGMIPFPCSGEQRLGGHAIVLTGYDDALKIKNKTCSKNVETKGAFEIRNSWGTAWGNAGYGYLPYQYVLKGLAGDCWSLLKNEWIDTGNFGL